MHLNIFKYDLKLKYPFSISRHTYFTQPNIVIELVHEGLSGYGEATTNPYYKITMQNLEESFQQMNLRLRNYSFSTPDQLFSDFSDCLEINPFALGALNNASWDLYGKINDIPIAQVINLESRSIPETSYTLGIDTADAMVKKMLELPWPVYKVKLGTSHDLTLIKQLRKNTTSKLRVDANCAWNAEETILMSEEMKRLGIDFIEQPLPRDDPKQSHCFKNSLLPLIADESCRTESDVDRCKENFHGINIKLLKCGGITPAIRMIKHARQLGLKIMIGCMTETSIGISAAAQLLPFVDYADLDGPLLLAEDLAEGINYEQGILSVSKENGLGITFKGAN